MLSAVEQRRLRVSKTTEAKKKSQFGQFLTPATIAQFMAGLFVPAQGGTCRLIDPGAGVGSLASAFLEQCASGKMHFDKVEITAFELDGLLHEELDRSLASYTDRVPLTYEVFDGDFIEEAVNRIQFRYGNSFSHAILNPPYKKIHSNSRHRLLLRQVDIETVNLYSAFVALTLALMAPGGQLVAIIPRSFCNGPYYRPFRNFVLERAAIRHLHLFESRKKAFKDDDVLQENVIVALECGGHQGTVTVSTSMDASFSDLSQHVHPFERIVVSDDPNRFIHVPTSLERNTIEQSPVIRHSLDELGIQVSTGPVVDFRLKEHLREMPEEGTIPLLYPGHFSGSHVEWPKAGTKKPNAIHRNRDTEKWLFPNGFYCVVRRLSSKEEKRRIVASVVRPDVFAGADALAFENHLNVFHQNRQGMPEALAHGLAVFLNATAVDDQFRRFNGHTQVNAADLRALRYPSRQTLKMLGEWAKASGGPSQHLIDEKLAAISA